MLFRLILQHDTGPIDGELTELFLSSCPQFYNLIVVFTYLFITRWVFEDLPELREAIREELSDFTISGDMKNYDSMRTLCEKIQCCPSRHPKDCKLRLDYLNCFSNKTLTKHDTIFFLIERQKPLKGSPLSRPNVGLLKHIIQKSYNHAVVDPEKLNVYNPWTPEVYGETSFEFVSQMLDSVSINENDVFIDLGSGVGQVVLQVAASVHLKKCIGIERAEVPDRYARVSLHFL